MSIQTDIAGIEESSFQASPSTPGIEPERVSHAPDDMSTFMAHMYAAKLGNELLQAHSYGNIGGETAPDYQRLSLKLALEAFDQLAAVMPQIRALAAQL